MKARSKSLQAIDINEYVHFVVRYLHWYEVVDRDKMNEKKREEFHGHVKKHLKKHSS